MDLTRLSTEDLKALRDGDITRVSDEGLQSLRGASRAPNGNHSPSFVDKAVEGIGKAGSQPGMEPASDMQADPEGTKTIAKVGTGLAIGGLAGAEATGSGMLGRASVNAGSAGLQKYLSNAMDQKSDRTEGVAGNAAFGGALSLGADTVANGASKLADYLMQKSVGMRKYIPGVGNRLVDQGFIGTKNGMAQQAEEKLPEVEKGVNDVIGGLSDPTPRSEISAAVSKSGSRFINPDTGAPFEGKEIESQKVRDLSDKISQGKPYSPKALLGLKRASDYKGYTASGNPATSLEAELEQAQADKARGLLSNMSGGESADALANEQAVILARNAASKPDAIHHGVGATAFFGSIPGSSLFGSAAAQAAQKGLATPANALADPRVLQSLFGVKNSSE